MRKYLLSAVLTMVFCVYSASAADFGTLKISSVREVIDDSMLSELAEVNEPSTLILRTPNGETGSLMFDGTNYHLQPCGQTDEFTYSVLFSADSENAYGLPYTEWFMTDSDIGQHIFDPVTEWDARHVCSVPRWRDLRYTAFDRTGQTQAAVCTADALFYNSSRPKRRRFPGNAVYSGTAPVSCVQ